MTEKVVTMPNTASIETEAAAWVVQFDGDDLSEEDRPAFREWISRSPKHKEAVLQLAALWDELHVLKLCEQYSEDLEPAQASPRWRTPVGIAAGLAALTLLAAPIIWMAQPFGGLAVKHATYATAVGEHKSLALPDGSKLTLNTGSLVKINFSKKARRIHLVRGEGHFDVAHDPGRPFEVEAGTGVVKAIGTAFSVQLKDEQEVEVIVTEGRIQIDSRAPANRKAAKSDDDPQPRAALATVVAGQNAVYRGEIQSIKPISPDELERKLAWRQGMLVFSGEPLERVIEEVGRYTTINIVITDPEIRDLRIGGYFRVGDTEVLLNTLQSDFGVRVDSVGDELYYVSSGA